MDIKICIPSYNRADNTVTPTNLGIKDYFVFVHDDEQAEEYRYYHKNVIVSNTIGITKQRNFILDYFPKGTQVLMCDDDIEGIYRLVGKSIIEMKPDAIKKLINKLFGLCHKNNIGLWGVYPIPNAFYMAHKFSYRTFIIGTFSGCIVSDIRMDEELKVKEDYDFTIQHILRDKGILRQDNIAVKAGHYTPGGCDYLRKTNEDKIAKEHLMAKYPNFVKKNPRSDNEILLKFPRK